MRILFRVDASVGMGTGHVMRCFTLASALRKRGQVCEFICRPTSGNLIAFLQDEGFAVTVLSSNINSEEEDANDTLRLIEGTYSLLVLDHYQLGKHFCKLLRYRCRTVAVIDDLANRAHDCDLIVDQNIFPNMKSRYQDLVSSDCLKLLGPGYALLREEFYHVNRNPCANHVLVSFGGSDHMNLTAMVIKAIAALKSLPITADIVIGSSHPGVKDIVNTYGGIENISLHVQTNKMATLMAKSQLMLGTGGTTHWERCKIGVPGLVVTVAENQQATTSYLESIGACVWLGEGKDMTVKIFADSLEYYLSQPDLLAQMGKKANTLIPYNAGTTAVVEHLLNLMAERND